jgi:hypothetical protein
MGWILVLAPIVPKSLLQWACWEPESAVPRLLPSRLDCCYLNSFVHNIVDWYVNLGCVERPNHKARSKHVCFSWVVKITSREHDDEKKKVLATNHPWWNKDWTANICHMILTWVPFWCQTHLCRTRWMFNNKIPQKCSNNTTWWWHVETLTRLIIFKAVRKFEVFKLSVVWRMLVGK